MEFKPNQLVIKYLYKEGDCIPHCTVARVVRIDDDGDLVITQYKTPIRATYTDANKWKPFSMKISRTKSLS